MGVHPSAERGFAAAAEAYARTRPGYPPAAVRWLAAALDLGPGRCVADVGAGTGKLTQALAELGCSVVAVEPVAPMRARLRASLPAVHALAGTAEALPLDDAGLDAETVAQAFHWFDAQAALAEIARVLRGGGGLGLVWNTWDAGQPLQRALHAIVERYRDGAPGHCYRERSDDEGWRARWRDAVAASGRFSVLEHRGFGHAQRLARDELAERIASISFVAALPAERRAAALGEVDRLARDLPARVELRYACDVFVARRLPAPR